jgi:signal transduction histidine kinase
MGELVASIAHEINQPLGAIVINAGNSIRSLSGEKPDLLKARDAITRIASDSQRAADVIRGLRALVQKNGPNISRVDIKDAIEEVLILTRIERQRHNIELRTALRTGDRLMLGDRVQLQQVILNLIMNGIEAMSTVIDRPRVLEISSEPVEEDHLLVAVHDTGPGLDPQIIGRIFDPFFTTKSNGMGMGLSVCRTIIEAHKGRFWTSPREPHGSSFQFTVPSVAPRSNEATR